jgi:hypothetical protein
MRRSRAFAVEIVEIVDGDSALKAGTAGHHGVVGPVWLTIGMFSTVW